MCANIFTEENHPPILNMNSNFMLSKIPDQIYYDNTINPSLLLSKNNLDPIIPKLLFSAIDSFTSSFTNKIIPATSLVA